MTFKHTSLVLVAAVSTLLVPDGGFANSVSPVSRFQGPYHGPARQSGFYTAPLCDTCDHTLEDGAIRTERMLPHMPDSLTFIDGSVNSRSASTDLQPYSSFDRDENTRADPAIHYPVVEPGTLTLFGTGLVLLAGVIRRKTARS